ncbi:MAG: recombinase zinc beta ribbon domain-containing protein [Deltaproteobacteria bacterium]|nr:recombinase zinc beta ribbon domain-containing protein [Deltaproteobacteria bacterium]
MFLIGNFLGLASCSACGCSITAERQKGHHYYRCTKKRESCAEPYVREENLVQQIQAGISKVALPPPVFQKMLAEWAKERDTTSQPIAEMKIELAEKLPELQVKLDRLLDAHLEGLIEKAEYQTKKEALLKSKVGLEEKLKQLEQGAIGWLEPCREFLEAAHQAHQVAANGNLESLKETAKKIGSNFRLAAKTLRFEYTLPWRLLAATADFENWGGLSDSNR